MKPEEFCQLHVHSHYSLLDGACKIEDLAALANRHGMSHLALTDHGNMFGAIEFYGKMLAADVTPIIGYEAYVAPGSRKDKQTVSGIKDAAFHLTLLATSNRGYKNLLKLSSIGYLEGFYYRPRIDFEALAEHKDGLIALSGCASSEVCRRILSDDEAGAEAAAARYADLFGKEHYFIEVQDNDLPGQKRCVEAQARIAERLGLGLVATNDIHYASPDDAAAHEVLLCINTGKTLSDPSRMRFGSNEFYFKSGKEMIERFGHLPGAVENTRAIAERCRVELDFNTRNFPHFQLPEGANADDYLRELCEQGLKKRYGTPAADVWDRLNHELAVIADMGFSSYFLIVWDIVRFIKGRGIATGLRGSGASSLVCYALEISDIDPLKYSLIFERFLDRERLEAPDLDIDICESRREEVIRYVREKFGEDKTAQIATFGTLRARAVVKDVARVLGWSVAEAEALAKRIPATLGITLKDAIEQDTSLADDAGNNARMKELLDYAMRLEGLNRHMSTHAAGMVIADEPLTEFIPLAQIKGAVVSQFAMNDLDKAGMLKVDLLGLNTLTIVDRTLDLVARRTGTRPDLASLPLDDQKTYELIGRGDTKAVFQLGSTGMQELLRRLRPETMEDIIAVVAMYRPGPLQSGMVDDFIARRHGEKDVVSLHPKLEETLRDTCGVIVYQEQIMRILHDLGGLSLGEALTTIKAVSKKKHGEIVMRRADFLEGAVKNGLEKGLAEQIFELIENFAQYGFNRAHSTAYAFLAYRTAYLKANYPMEFAAADLTCEMGHSDKLKEHIRDCRRRMHIKLLPPSVNDGMAEFTVGEDGRAIRFGMAGVRNVGTKAVEAIVAAREEGGAFASLHDFCERVNTSAVNRQAMESLVKAGAFDALPGHRAQKLAGLEAAMRQGAATQADRLRGQGNLFNFGDADASAPAPALPPVPEWPRQELGRFEKEALGMRLSFDPMERYATEIELLATTDTRGVAKKRDGEEVILAGEVVSVRPLLTKRGRGMAQFDFEDGEGSIRAVAFPDAFEKIGSLIAEDALLFIRGTVDKSGDRAGLHVFDAVPAAEAMGRLAKSVKLQFDRQRTDHERLLRVRELCGKFPGNSTVFVEITMPDNSRTLIRAGANMTVVISPEFVAAAREIVGPNGLKLAPPPRRRDGNGTRNGRRQWGANGRGDH